MIESLNVVKEKDDPVTARKRGNGAMDGRGTVRMLTSGAGAVTDTYEYDAFGNEISHTGATQNNYLYRGEQYDSDLGLYYLRARWYNPVTGRFMTRDPYAGSIYDPTSLHRYNYARANPVNNIDPSGRATASDYGLLAANAVARAAVVTSFGFAVNCALFAEASAFDLVGQHIDQQIDQLVPLWQDCAARITASQYGRALAANTGLMGLGEAAGWAFGSLGGLMEGAEQGFWPRLLAGEEGSFGPRGSPDLISAQKLAQQIMDQFKNLQCVPCANALAKAFSEAGFDGQYLRIKTIGDTEYILSDFSPGDTPISDNGFHQGVVLNINGENYAFDNFANGVQLQEFLSGLESRFGITWRLDSW